MQNKIINLISTNPIDSTKLFNIFRSDRSKCLSILREMFTIESWIDRFEVMADIIASLQYYNIFYMYIFSLIPFYHSVQNYDKNGFYIMMNHLKTNHYDAFVKLHHCQNTYRSSYRRYADILIFLYTMDNLNIITDEHITIEHRLNQIDQYLDYLD